MNHLPQSQWWRPLPLFFSYFWMYVIFIYIYMIIYEWRTKLYIAYCSQWTWPKWVVPYRLWRFQHKFEQPKSSPYYFSFPLIFSVTHIYKYMHTCMLDNAMSLVSLPAPLTSTWIRSSFACPDVFPSISSWCWKDATSTKPDTHAMANYRCIHLPSRCNGNV